MKDREQDPISLELLETSKAKPFRILLAEDNCITRNRLSWLLRKEGCEVSECTDCLQLLLTLKATVFFDLIVCSSRFPPDLVDQVHVAQAFPPIILIGKAQTLNWPDQLGVLAVFDEYQLEEFLTIVDIVRESAEDLDLKMETGEALVSDLVETLIVIRKLLRERMGDTEVRA